MKSASKKRAQGGLSVADLGYLEGEQDTAQLFLTYILRNEQEEKPVIKNELTFKRVRLEDIVQAQRKPSAFEAFVVELANDLKPGDAEMINPEKGLQYGNFNTRISKMRIANKLADDITTKKNADGIYLVRLPAGQKVKQVERSTKKQMANA